MDSVRAPCEDVECLFVGRQVAAACLVAQSIASDKDKGIIGGLVGMMRAAILAIVLLLYLVVTLEICEMHCHQASREGVLFSCAAHRHSYPKAPKSAEIVMV